MLAVAQALVNWDKDSEEEQMCNIITFEDLVKIVLHSLDRRYELAAQLM